MQPGIKNQEQYIGWGLLKDQPRREAIPPGWVSRVFVINTGLRAQSPWICLEKPGLPTREFSEQPERLQSNNSRAYSQNDS